MMKARGEEMPQQRIIQLGNVLKATSSQDAGNYCFLWLACVNYNATFDSAEGEAVLINNVNEDLCTSRDFNSFPSRRRNIDPIGQTQMISAES
ncbi:hypothetical protein E2C01_052037 [Portunus trituberculatus]|uniref:Uncharacterized protein n=1 Tax=Portunus trituberculatus TaxID=210409 RepID=A0A5B7GNC2_PORTR|nr:hypothetical protein [Portunus trituberculatus]